MKIRIIFFSFLFLVFGSMLNAEILQGTEKKMYVGKWEESFKGVSISLNGLIGETVAEEICEKEKANVKEDTESSVFFAEIEPAHLKGKIPDFLFSEEQIFTVITQEKMFLAKRAGFEIEHFEPLPGYNLKIKLIPAGKSSFYAKNYYCIILASDFLNKLFPAAYYRAIKRKESKKVKKFIEEQIEGEIKKIEEHKESAASLQLREKDAYESFKKDPSQVIEEINFFQNSKNKDYLLVSYFYGICAGFSALMKYYKKSGEIEFILPVFYSDYAPHVAPLIEIDFENDGKNEYFLECGYYEGINAVVIKYDEKNKKYSGWIFSDYEGM